MKKLLSKSESEKTMIVYHFSKEVSSFLAQIKLKCDNSGHKKQGRNPE